MKFPDSRNHIGRFGQKEMIQLMLIHFIHKRHLTRYGSGAQTPASLSNSSYWLVLWSMVTPTLNPVSAVFCSFRSHSTVTVPPSPLSYLRPCRISTLAYERSLIKYKLVPPPATTPPSVHRMQARLSANRCPLTELTRLAADPPQFSSPPARLNSWTV